MKSFLFPNWIQQQTTPDGFMEIHLFEARGDVAKMQNGQTSYHNSPQANMWNVVINSAILGFCSSIQQSFKQKVCL